MDLGSRDAARRLTKQYNLFWLDIFQTCPRHLFSFLIMTIAKRSTLLILLLVCLRLATGWHFFNEGYKKLDSSFTSAYFLRAAKGPFAPLMKSFVNGPYDGYAELAVPRKYNSLDSKIQKEIDSWNASYNSQAAKALKAGDPLPSIEGIPEQASYAAWFKSIKAGWQASYDRLAELPMANKENLAKAQSLIDDKLKEVLYYLVGEEAAITDMQHEAWRYKQMVDKEEADDAAPYYSERLADKENELYKAVLPWTKTIASYEDALFDEMTPLMAGDDSSRTTAKRIRGALAERSWLNHIDWLVTWTVLLSGIGLFLGLFTRVAAIAAACFLLSVIVSQPPWVAGSDTTYFFYQLVEVISLLIIAAVGAGQWAGLDSLAKAFWMPAIEPRK